LQTNDTKIIFRRRKKPYIWRG